MSDNLKSEIQEAIRKNLPAHLSEELRAQLNEIPILEDSIRTENQLRTRAESVLEVTKTQLSAANAEIQKHNALQAREDAVLKREQKIELLEFKVQAADAARTEMRSIVSDVFANNRFKYHETRDQVVADVYGQGGGTSHRTVPIARQVEGQG